MDLKAKVDVRVNLDKIHKEMETRCEDYPKSRVCYVHIREAFR
jgi:hypothetical protein